MTLCRMNERFEWAVEEATGLEHVRIPYSVLHKMAHVFRENHFHVQCVVRKTSRDVFVYDILPADKKPVIGGLAVDIGTTTVSAILMNMETGGNTGQGFFRKRADPLWGGCDQPDY